MFKLGKMCHCSNVWNVRVFDGATGDTLMYIDTFNGTSTGLPASKRCHALLLDGDDLYTWASDLAVPGEDDGRLQKWTGLNSNSPSRAWFSDRNSFTAAVSDSEHDRHPTSRRIGIDGSGNLFIRVGSTLQRAMAWNSSGVQQASAVVTTAGWAVSGAQFGQLGTAGTASTVVEQRNTSLSVVDSSAWGGTTDRMTVPQLGGVSPVPGGGWFLVGAATTGTPVAMYLDSSLDLSGTFSASSRTGRYGCVNSDGSKGYVVTESSGPVYRLHQIDISGMSEDWNATISAWGTAGTALLATNDTDVFGYVGGNVYSWSCVDGSENWHVSSLGTEIHLYPHPDGGVVECESGGVAAPEVRLLAESDGSEVWKTTYSTVASSINTCDLFVDDSGRVFVAGSRIKRSGGTDNMF